MLWFQGEDSLINSDKSQNGYLDKSGNLDKST